MRSEDARAVALRRRFYGVVYARVDEWAEGGGVACVQREMMAAEMYTSGRSAGLSRVGRSIVYRRSAAARSEAE